MFGWITFDDVNLSSPNTVTKYYMHGGHRVAMRRDENGTSNVYYLLDDHLSTISTVIDSSGNAISESRHFPFGADRWTSGTNPTDYRFTGQREDVGIGLYYYNARWYDAQVGRFISADTIVPEPTNPQALNRYSYVVNNPLLLVDPTGHIPMLTSGSGFAVIPTAPASTVSAGNSPPPPVINSAPRPTSSGECLICLPTSTPTPLLNYGAPSGPLPTQAPQYVQGPTSTPTAGTYITQGQPLPPTPTPLPNGSVNWGGIYWSAASNTATEAMENIGMRTVLPYGIRAGGRVIGTVPIPKTMLIGYGVTIAPNIYNNFSNGDGFMGPKLYADIATDTTGFGASVAAGWFVGLGGFAIGGPPGAIAGDIVGSAGASAGWDYWVAPEMSNDISSWLSSIFGD